MAVLLVALTSLVNAQTLSRVDSLSVAFPTEPGLVYQVEVSDDLNGWQARGPGVLGTGGEVALMVPGTILDEDRQWFRVRSGLPPVAPGWSVALGQGADAYARNSVAIGRNAVAGGLGHVGGGDGSETVALGSGASARGWRTTSLGHGAVAEGVSSTAVGRKAVAVGAHAVAVGRGAYVDPVFSPLNTAAVAADHLYVGGPAGAHKFIDRSGDSYASPDGGRWDVRNAPPRPVAIHGWDAFDARHQQDPGRFPEGDLDTDVDGGDLRLVAGTSTGAGMGGAITMESSSPGFSGSARNEAAPLARFEPIHGDDGATPFLILDTRTGKLTRVYIGPPDSSGDGFRALRVAN